MAGLPLEGGASRVAKQQRLEVRDLRAQLCMGQEQARDVATIQRQCIMDPEPLLAVKSLPRPLLCIGQEQARDYALENRSRFCEAFMSIQTLLARQHAILDPVERLKDWSEREKALGQEVLSLAAALVASEVLPPSLLSDGTGPIRSLGLKLSDTRVYGSQIRARLGTTTPPSMPRQGFACP